MASIINSDEFTYQQLFVGSSVSFTPSVSFGGNSVGVTYTTRTGSYMRIGKMCCFVINIVLSSKGSSVGDLAISNLPFTATNTTSIAVRVGALDAAVDEAHYQGIITTATTAITLSKVVNGAAVNFDNADLGNTSLFTLSGSYEITV